jgi:hypothetical protein
VGDVPKPPLQKRVPWPDERPQRIFPLGFGLIALAMTLPSLLDPRGGFPPGDLRGGDPGYFVPGLLFFVVLGTLAILSALLPMTDNERLARAGRIAAGIASMAIGIGLLLNHAQYSASDPRSNTLFWPAMFGWFAFVGVVLIAASFVAPRWFIGRRGR